MRKKTCILKGKGGRGNWENVAKIVYEFFERKNLSTSCEGLFFRITYVSFLRYTFYISWLAKKIDIFCIVIFSYRPLHQLKSTLKTAGNYETV